MKQVLALFLLLLAVSGAAHEENHTHKSEQNELQRDNLLSGFKNSPESVAVVVMEILFTGVLLFVAVRHYRRSS